MAAPAVLSPFLLSLIVFVNTAPFYWPLPPFVWLTAARLSQKMRTQTPMSLLRNRLHFSGSKRQVGRRSTQLFPSSPR